MEAGIRVGMLAVAACVVALANPATAQPQATAHYSLPSQNLAAALRQVGQVAGVEVMFTPDEVAGIKAPALDGTLTLTEALDRLLAGTGLTASYSNGAVIIRGRSTPPRQNVTDAAETNADIVVTGTHIRGATPSVRVQSYSRKSIEQAGRHDLGDLIRSIPENFNGGQNPGVAGGGDQGGSQNSSSSSTFNLRGLGPDATLTLLNGHRLAYDTIAQGVDVSQIPVAAIDRVEVVTDGSSALYGSDAVGGVANVILRRDFDHLLASARIGASTDGGDFQQQYDLLTGARWASGGFMAGGDYSTTTGVTARQRGYTQNLDGSATLMPWQRQISGILAGHQRLGDDITLEFDGQVNRRVSEIDTPTSTTADVKSNGLTARPTVVSETVSSTLRWDVGSGWSIAAAGTYGTSKNHIDSRRYSGGRQILRSSLNYDNSLAAAELGADGRVLSIPGGDVRVAAGGGYRHVGLDVLTRQTVGASTRTTADITSGRSLFFAYGELLLPLVGDANRSALIDRLQIDLAARYERYSRDAHLLTPKVGLMYRPIPAVTVRVSWGQSFKTPTSYQQYQARQGILLPAALFKGAPNALPILILGGGNPNLRPEKATTWSSGVDIQPKGLDGLELGADYFDIRYRDRVVSPITNLLSSFSDPVYRDYILLSPSAPAVASIIASLPQGLSNQTGAPFDPAGIGAVVDSSLQNAARQHLRGVDIHAGYKLDLGSADTLDLKANGTYLSSNRQLGEGFPFQSLAGTIFNPPHWRGRAGGTYQQGNVTLSAFANYIGGTRDNRYTPAPKVGSFTTFDVVGQIASEVKHGFRSGVKLTVSILNLFNEKPDIIRNAIPTDPPYDSTNYSVSGRTVSLTISKAF